MKEVTESSGSQFHTQIWCQGLCSSLYSAVDTTDRIEEVKASKHIEETNLSPFLKLLSFTDNGNCFRSLGDLELMLKSEVRAEGADSRPTGSGQKRWGGCRQRSRKGKVLPVGRVAFLALFEQSRLGGPWRSFSAPCHFTSEARENGEAKWPHSWGLNPC